MDKKNSVINFGVAGWGTILYCLFMFFFYVGMINDGTNVLAPAAAQNIGVSPGTVIQANGYAGMIAVIGFIIVGQINKKDWRPCNFINFYDHSRNRIYHLRKCHNASCVYGGNDFMCNGDDVSGLHSRRYSGSQLVSKEKGYRDGIHDHGT